MKNRFLVFVLIFPFYLALSQEKTIDSISVNQLQEVVITGQFEPQSIKKSVFNVRVISKNDIQKLAANNLADVLNQYLNITVSPNSGTGKSTVSMFGLDGNYFKILVDNVPVVSDSGLGNNVDLSQINLDDVEQIEIIEGSMGVTHGANTVSGILNIITKKSSKNKWEIGTTVQEETVGKEYALSNKGRHIQSLKVSNAINKNWFASIGFNRNDFAGYLDDRKGATYSETDLKRGFTWLPKLQLLTNGMLSYKKDNFRAFYKFDYLNENIDYYNPSVIVVANPPFEENKFSKDKRYLTERFFHHWNAKGKLFQLNYNTSLSFQKQTRSVENFD
jgi:outer membrane receptor for ferrienterochelin and colicins